MPTAGRNLLKLPRALTDKMLAMAPRRFRVKGAADTTFHEMPVPDDSHIAFLKTYFRHSGASDAERLAACEAIFPVLAQLPRAGFRRAGYERLLLEMSKWDPDSVRAAAKVHEAVRASAPSPTAANEWMGWFFERQFQGRAEWFQGNRIPEDLYLDYLRRNHPDFRDIGTPGFDPSRVYRAREAYDRAARFDRSLYQIHGFPSTTDKFAFGRNLEAAFKNHLDANHALLRDLDDPLKTQLSYVNNFPEVDLVYQRGNEVLIAQVTHGDLGFLRDKYLRLIGELDVMPFKEADVYNTAIQLLIQLHHLPSGAGARSALLRSVRLLVPEDSVDGLRLLMASHDRFEQWAGGVLSHEEKLSLIQPIGAAVISRS